jgi:hypothetical protein
MAEDLGKWLNAKERKRQVKADYLLQRMHMLQPQAPLQKHFSIFK